MARSRIPRRDAGSGESRTARESAADRCLTRRVSVRCTGMARTRRIWSSAREAVLEKAHEGADGGEPRVARAGAVAPLVLEMVEEREHEGRVAVLDLEVRGGDAEAAA